MRKPAIPKGISMVIFPFQHLFPLTADNISPDISFCRCRQPLKSVNYQSRDQSTTKKHNHQKTEETEMEKAMNVIFKGIAVAMGVAVVVLSIMGSMSAETGILLLGIGLSALAIDALQK
jgi:hypothetical protein